MFDNNSTQNPYSEIVQAARTLLKSPERTVRRKLAGALFWGIVLLCASAALSQVTGSVLTRLMDDWLAYLLGAILHLAIGLSIHLLVVGAAQGDPRDKTFGVVFLALSLVSLFYVFIARSFNIMAELGKSPAFAWSLSGFLLLIEVVIPALLGYFLAKSWLSHNEAVEEKHFYQNHHQLIEESERPSERWNDAEARLDEEIAETQKLRPHAKPEGQVAIDAKTERLRERLNTLREWNPTRSYQRSDDHARPDALTTSGNDGKGDLNALQKSISLSHLEKQGDAAFKNQRGAASEPPQ
jgi:hypothetical protein